MLMLSLLFIICLVTDSLAQFSDRQVMLAAAATSPRRYLGYSNCAMTDKIRTLLAAALVATPTESRTAAFQLLLMPACCVGRCRR